MAKAMENAKKEANLYAAISSSKGKFPFGTTAELKPQAIVAEPSNGRSSRNHKTSFVVIQAQRVDVIEQDGEKTQITFPGVGVVTVSSASLQGWRWGSLRQDSTGSSSRKQWNQPAVTALVCHLSDGAAVIDALPYFGSKLTSLALSSCPIVAASELKKMLTQSPQLIKFAVVGGEVATWKPMLQAYKTKTKPCKIATLIYQPPTAVAAADAADAARRAIILDVFKAMSPAGDPMAKVMKQLCFESIVLTKEDLRVIVESLEGNRHLQHLRLRIKGGNDSKYWDKVFLLMKLRGASHKDAKRSKAALYTFCLAARRHFVLRNVPLASMQLVATYAAIPIRRHVAWSETSSSHW